MTGWQLFAACALVTAVCCLRPEQARIRLDHVLADTGGRHHGRRTAASHGGASVRTRLLGAAAGAVAALVTLPMPWSIAVGLVAASAAHWLLGRAESRSSRRRKERLLLQQPEVLDLLSSSLESGAALRTATADVALIAPQPSAQILAEVAAHVAVGFSEAQAWRNLRDEPVWGDVARDLARSARTGEAVAEILRTRAQRARQRRHNHLAARAKTVGVHAVGPMMVCFLPAFVLVGVVPIIAGTVTRLLG